MRQQAIKQRARRTAREMAERHRRDRADQERRVVGMAERVMVALGERDASVAATERRAGEALREMTEHEGLTLREAVKWCGDTLSSREATRLRRVAVTPPDGGPDRGRDEGLDGQETAEDGAWAGRGGGAGADSSA